jgi:hypothetical protein
MLSGIGTVLLRGTKGADAKEKRARGHAQVADKGKFAMGEKAPGLKPG